MVLLIAAFILYVVASLTICTYALIRGGANERLAAAAFVAAAIASEIVAVVENARYQAPEYGVMVVDIAFFAALLFIAHRSNRFWPLWAAAAQLVGIVTHVAKMAQPSIVMEAYATIQPFWAFPILGAIAVGAASARTTGQ